MLRVRPVIWGDPVDGISKPVGALAVPVYCTDQGPPDGLLFVMEVGVAPVKFMMIVELAPIVTSPAEEMLNVPSVMVRVFEMFIPGEFTTTEEELLV